MATSRALLILLLAHVACAPATPPPTRGHPPAAETTRPLPTPPPSTELFQPPPPPAPAIGPPVQPPPMTVNAHGDRLPSDFDPAQMAATAIDPMDRFKDAKVTARVLMWRVHEDDRPLYLQGAILWVDVRRAGQPARWILANVYRHPREPKPRGEEWRLAVIDDGPAAPLKRFDRPPTNADVKTFLQESFWNEPLPRSFTQHAAGTCPKGWKIALGAPPDVP